MLQRLYRMSNSSRMPIQCMLKSLSPIVRLYCAVGPGFLLVWRCPASCVESMQAVPEGLRNWYHWLVPTLAWPKSNWDIILLSIWSCQDAAQTVQELRCPGSDLGGDPQDTIISCGVCSKIVRTTEYHFELVQWNFCIFFFFTLMIDWLFWFQDVVYLYFLFIYLFSSEHVTTLAVQWMFMCAKHPGLKARSSLGLLWWKNFFILLYFIKQCIISISPMIS